MKSAYPSSQSFFDASSDSIRAIDVEKCRTNSSFSSLSDLFARNPNGKSDLFTSVRTPVFVPSEVTFPSRKNRECEDRVAEKVSLWHEWGSGECPGEESSSLLSEMLEPSSSELVRAPSSNLFPNLGSANVSMVPEEFTFPERRKREDESWRERRGFRQDWVPSGPAVDNNVRESTSVISSVVDFFAKNPAKPSSLLSNSKSNLFSNLGTPVGSQSEFPARRKRNENPFWKDYSSCADVTPSECTTSGSNTSGVNSLSGLYSKSPSGKCSSLFSSLGSTNVSSEEVVFPSRKKNPDRNAWRDWSNTGYSDWAEGDSEDKISQPKALAAQEQVQIASGAEKLRSFARPLQPAATRKHKKDDSGDVHGLVTLGLSSHNFGLSDHEMVQFAGDEFSGKPSASSVVGPLLFGKEDGKCQGRDPVVPNDGDACNAEEKDSSIDRLGLSGTLEGGCGQSVSEGEDDDGDDTDVEVEDGDNIYIEGRYRSSRRDPHEQRVSRQKVHSFPPPLGFLGRQGSLRVPHHVPWVQLQPVRSEGRFMLHEVKVTQAVVFEPIREQGRLVLQLIRQEDVSTPIERNGQGCHVVNGDSGIPCKEMIEGHAKESLEAEEKHVSRTVNEPDAVDRERVKEKARKANKHPKIYPECCLPSPTGASDTIPKQVEKDMDSSIVEQIPLQLQLSVKEHKTMVAQLQMEEGLSENCSDSWPDRGCKDRSANQCPPSFTSGVVVDEGNEETPAPTHREAEVPSLRYRSWKNPSGKLRETDSQASYKSAFRSCSPRNAVPTESGLPLAPLSIHRSRSVRNTALSEFGRSEGEKEEASKDRWRGREGECYEPRPPFVSSGQGFDGSLGSHATGHFLHWSLRKRPEAPGDPDARLTSFPPVTASFLCADGVGKRHHEKSFWEQPCVS